MLQKSFYFWWYCRTKINFIHRGILKGGNGDHNYSRCQDIRDKKFEILHSAIALDKLNLECSETVDAKSTINDTYFIN